LISNDIHVATNFAARSLFYQILVNHQRNNCQDAGINLSPMMLGRADELIE
jgi:hypothetical protein